MAGLPESKIEAAALRGLVDLDASSNALIALKQKGATERVLKPWCGPSPLARCGNGSRRKIALCRASLAPPACTIKGPSEWVRLRSFLLWPPLYSSRNVSSRRSHEYNVPLGGSHQDLQIRELQPAFYLREPRSSPLWRSLTASSIRSCVPSKSSRRKAESLAGTQATHRKESQHEMFPLRGRRQ
jgi:hypothetical protein